MLIFIFICIVGVGGFAAFRLLAPEMYVRINSRSHFHFPWSRPHLTELEDPSDESYPIVHLPPVIDLPLAEEQIPMSQKLQKIETLLLEKNKMIDRLQNQLEAERANRGEFEKVKGLLDEEIVNLKSKVKSLNIRSKQNA